MVRRALSVKKNLKRKPIQELVQGMTEFPQCYTASGGPRKGH